jgi:hypothetical protein
MDLIKAEPTFDLETLAQKFGQLATPAPDGGKFLWKHRVAAFLHGWETHEYHEAKPVLLSEADYKAALNCVDTQTVHAPADRKAAK